MTVVLVTVITRLVLEITELLNIFKDMYRKKKQKNMEEKYKLQSLINVYMYLVHIYKVHLGLFNQVSENIISISYNIIIADFKTTVYPASPYACFMA